MPAGQVTGWPPPSPVSPLTKLVPKWKDDHVALYHLILHILQPMRLHCHWYVCHCVWVIITILFCFLISFRRLGLRAAACNWFQVDLMAPGTSRPIYCHISDLAWKIGSWIPRHSRHCYTTRYREGEIGYRYLEGNHKHLNGLRQHYFARHVIRWEDNGANC